MIRRQEVRFAVQRGVVDQGAGALVDAGDQDEADTADLIAVCIGLPTDDVDDAVTVPRDEVSTLAADRPEQVSEPPVDGSELELQIRNAAGRNGDLDDRFVAGQQWGPQLPVLLVVCLGERPDNLCRVRRVDQQPPPGRHDVAREPEIQRDGAGRRNPQPPYGLRTVFQRFPSPPVGRGRGHDERRGESHRTAARPQLPLFSPARRGIDAWNLEDLDAAQRTQSPRRLGGGCRPTLPLPPPP